MAKKKIASIARLVKSEDQKPKAANPLPDSDLRTYTIRDYRLEKPSFTLRQVRAGD